LPMAAAPEAVAIMMHHVYNDDEHYVSGAYGTLAPVANETFYDDRSDAEDDMEKGHINFPREIYGRERELDLLHGIYARLADSKAKGKQNDLPKTETESTGDPLSVSRAVFLSGCNGVGKSTLVKEFLRQLDAKFNATNDLPILHVSGKYTKNSAVTSAPFSAIAEVLERLVSDLSARNVNAREKIPRHHDLCSKVRNKIQKSKLIGSGTAGHCILRATFPALDPIIDSRNYVLPKQSSKERCDPSVPPTDNTFTQECSFSSQIHSRSNAIQEYTYEILSIISETLDHPLVLFLDDLQWADEASIRMISFLLSSTKLNRIMFIGAYRSNEISSDHPLKSLIERVTEKRSGNATSSLNTMEIIELIGLTPEAIAIFIAECVKKDNADGVADLVYVVYQATMGNMLFVKQALNELVRKNALFYDVMSFEWAWDVTGLELENYLSNQMDIYLEVTKSKIKDFPAGVQRLLIVMAVVPNALDVSMLKALMDKKLDTFQESTILKLLKVATNEGMLMFSANEKGHVLSHDIVRQASLQIEPKADMENLLINISDALLIQAKSREMEWCRFLAVDILNSIASNKINRVDLVKLNLEVSKVARREVNLGKENEMLQIAQTLLTVSGMCWIDYHLTLEVYNALILSCYSLGDFDRANAAIDEVIKHGKSSEDKLAAYSYQLFCKCDHTRDYRTITEEGVRILNKYGYAVPLSPTKAYMIKEQAKLKISLGSCSYSCLINLQVTHEPIILLFVHVMRCALFSSQERLLKILAWKAISFAARKGVDKSFPVVLATLGASFAKEGKVKTAHVVGNTALALSEKIQDDKEMYALARMMTYSSIISQLHSFRSVSHHLLQCHEDLKVTGNNEGALGSMLNHFHAIFAGGLELGPRLESKLRVAEEICQDKTSYSFMITFQMLRQFAFNLRKSTERPTEFEGGAFNIKERLKEMSGENHYMALRDSSSYQLQLAFIFRDENKMAAMLSILSRYPLIDQSVARLHNRLCFMGFAAITLCRRKGSQKFHKMGQYCFTYFAHLAKHGSLSARPVHLFMLAIKTPSREAFQKAIDACGESNMLHLQAMANENYSEFLNDKGDLARANDFMALAYWQYRDWGADAKALKLLKEHEFLNVSK